MIRELSSERQLAEESKGEKVFKNHERKHIRKGGDIRSFMHMAMGN